MSCCFSIIWENRWEADQLECLWISVNLKEYLEEIGIFYICFYYLPNFSNSANKVFLISLYSSLCL